MDKKLSTHTSRFRHLWILHIHNTPHINTSVLGVSSQHSGQFGSASIPISIHICIILYICFINPLPAILHPCPHQLTRLFPFYVLTLCQSHRLFHISIAKAVCKFHKPYLLEFFHQQFLFLCNLILTTRTYCFSFHVLPKIS